MAKHSSRPLSTSVQIVLLFLVVCLSMHFLIEDLVFLSIQSDLIVNMESIDELTHQDDLIQSVNLPVHIMAYQPFFGFSTIEFLQAQVFFPILHPPKI